jgi:cobalt/nickel transport system permease protein
MHLAEGLLPLKQVIATSAIALPIVLYSAYSLRKALKKENETPPAARAFLSMSFALCFAVTLLPVPIPIAGASSHMCVTPLLALLLGPAVIPIITCAILLIQALFFAHGGLSTLGANVLTLGVIGPIATLLLYSTFKSVRLTEKYALMTSCFLGSIAVYAADSFLLAWSFADKQPFTTTFTAVLLGFMPAQLPLSFLEGMISAGILTYLAKYRTELSQFARGVPRISNAVATIFLAIYASYFASRSEISYANSGDFSGIDDAVFIKTAEDLGAKAVDITPWLTGEIELSVFSIGFLVAGFVAGRSYMAWKFAQNNKCTAEASPA